MNSGGFELGGCCLARYGSTTPSYYTSKTEQIMSKYRPIAPKPFIQPPNEIASTPLQPQTPKICAVDSTRTSRGSGRCRKRNIDSVCNSPRPTKRVSRSRSTQDTDGGSVSLHRQKHSDTSDDTVSTVCELSPSNSVVSKSFHQMAYVSASSCSPSSSSDYIPNANIKSGGDMMAESELATLPLLPTVPQSSVTNTTPLDTAALEGFYSTSSEPVLLVNNRSRQILWCNAAYGRLVTSPKLFYGFVPKPLACLQNIYTLWSFVRGKPSPTVIVPQALRPVGSTVTVESVTELESPSPSPSSDVNVEELEECLENETSPALLTDGKYKARWANSAYRQMIGQPECSWLGQQGKINRINGDVSICFSDKIKRVEGKAFSCIAKLQWEKNSMTVPCDVFRIVCSANEAFYAWRFDVQAALSL